MVKTDDNFYFRGHYIVFQAQDTLFRVPSEPLVRESQFFADMFTLPIIGPSESVEGLSDSKPIMLPENITASSFRHILKVLYSTDLITEASATYALALNKLEWTSVLELSTLWYFTGLRKIAIIRLTPLIESPIEKVCLGRKYKVAFWIMQGYQSLVEREETITNDEAIALKSHSSEDYAITALSLFRIREQKVGKNALYKTEVRALIEIHFKDELAAIREDEKVYGVVDEVPGALTGEATAISSVLDWNSFD